MELLGFLKFNGLCRSKCALRQAFLGLEINLNGLAPFVRALIFFILDLIGLPQANRNGIEPQQVG